MMETTPDSTAILDVGAIETPKQFSQLGILLLDGSGSMADQAPGNITKAQAVNNATREMFTRFRVSRVRRNFSFAVVTFDERADVRLKPTEVMALDDNANYSPLDGHGGGTKIFAALESAAGIADEFLSQAPPDGVPHSAIILVMSDGCCSDPAKTREVAESLARRHGERVKICAALFATVGNVDASGAALLKAIATDPVMGYKTVYDGEALRTFFERSISAASGGVQIG